MVAGAGRASSAVGGTIERNYRFGTEVVRLRFAGGALVDALTPAVAHLATDADVAADITVELWDSESTGADLSPLITMMRERIAYDHYQFLSPRHEVLAISNDRVPATLDQWSGAFSLFDRQRAHGVYWVESSALIPYFERAAPLRTLLSWALSDRGIESVHAAAVGSVDGGVLLAGRGGSGKSSTALACLAAGMGHLADDYCLIGDGPRAYSMYGVAKVNGLVDLQRMPQFLPHVVNPESSGSEKLVLHLGLSHPESLVESFPIVAVVVPKVVEQPRSELRPTSAASALRALGPTTLLQRPGSGERTLRAMSELVQGVPCLELRLGTDSSDVPALLAGLLA